MCIRSHLQYVQVIICSVRRWAPQTLVGGLDVVDGSVQQEVWAYIGDLVLLEDSPDSLNQVFTVAGLQSDHGVDAELQKYCPGPVRGHLGPKNGIHGV